jgi:hypothetical protein
MKWAALTRSAAHFFWESGPVQFATYLRCESMRATSPKTDRGTSYSHSMVLGGFELMS